MRLILALISGLFLNSWCFCQLVVVPTSTAEPIVGVVSYADTLFIVGDVGYLAKSSNEGASWIDVPSYGISGYGNKDFQIRDGKYYYLAVEGSPYDHNYVMCSSDFGQTWQQLYDTTGLFQFLHMHDTTFGVMGGGFGRFALTDGNDTSWQIDTLSGVLMAGGSFGDSTYIIQTGNDNFCYTTDNRGQNWNWESSFSGFAMKIDYLNKDTIYSIFNTGDLHSYFSYSFDGGANFNTVFMGYSSDFDYFSEVYDYYFDSPQHGYLVGYMYDSLYNPVFVQIDKGTIFETNDFGQTWIPHVTSYSEHFYSIECVDDSIIYIGGENGLLLRWNKNTPLSLSNDEVVTFEFYPNPSDESITINLSEKYLPSMAEIYDQKGRLIDEIELKNVETTFSINALKKGIYILSVEGINRKLIVE